MDGERRRRLTRDLTIGLILTVGSVAAVLIIIVHSCSHIISQRQMNVRMENMTDELARVLVFPLWNGDQEVIRQIAGAYLNSEYLTGIRVVTEYGDVLYDHFPEGADKVLIREAMIRQGDHYFGQVQLQFSRQSIERRQRSTIVAVIIIGLPLITVIIVGAHFAMRRLLNESSKTSF